MSALQDQFAQLPHLTWREKIILPVSERSHEFAHEGADHAVIYRNGVAVEQTGAGARVFSYTSPMREGITRGPYGGLFSSTLLKLWRSFHDDKSPGILYDPIYGPVLCVPQRWAEATDIQKRDGVDVQFSFKEHTPDDGTNDAANPSLDSLTTDAQRLDEAVAQVPWSTWAGAQQQPPPEAVSDPLTIGAGLIQQGNWMVARSKAAVSDVAYRMKEVEDSSSEAEANGIPGAGILRQDARRGRLHATKVANAPPRSTAAAVIQVTTSAPRDLFASAKALGMTLQGLIELNPRLALDPNVPAGTRIWTRKPR